MNSKKSALIFALCAFVSLGLLLTSSQVFVRVVSLLTLFGCVFGFGILIGRSRANGQKSGR